MNHSKFFFRRLPFALVALFLFSLSACTPEEDDDEEPEPEPTPLVVTGPDFSADEENLHFFHAWLANCINDQYTKSPVPSASELLALAKTRIEDAAASSTISGEFGKTELVWGPQLSVNPTDIATAGSTAGKLMYCLRSTSAENVEHYYVGVAGTNSLAVLNWYSKDLDAGAQAAWLGNKGNIAAGANRAFEAVNGFTDPTSSKTLLSFLKDAATDNTNETYIHVAGHGLGGVMAQLYASNLENDIDNERTFVNAWVYGAPAIGDAAFGQAITTDLGNRYHAYANSLDVVSHLFNTSDLNEVCAIYNGKKQCDNDLSPSLEINGILRYQEGTTSSGNYVEVGAPTNFSTTGDAHDDCNAQRLAIDLWWYEGGDIYTNLNDMNNHCESGSNISFTQFSRYYYFMLNMKMEHTAGYINHFIADATIRNAVETFVPAISMTVEGDAQETMMIDVLKATNAYMDANNVTNCDCN